MRKKDISESRYRYGKRLYTIWIGMRRRCENDKHDAYERYGGRGISVCKEWSDYETFATWALENGYEEDLTIERKDVNGNYCPDNCCWITRSDQARNRRSSTFITYKGETKTAAEWARDLGFGKHTILRRFKKGLPIEEVMSPVKTRSTGNPKKKVYQYKDGKLIKEWECAQDAADELGKNVKTISWACNSSGKAYGYEWSYERKKNV